MRRPTKEKACVTIGCITQPETTGLAMRNTALKIKKIIIIITTTKSDSANIGRQTGEGKINGHGESRVWNCSHEIRILAYEQIISDAFETKKDTLFSIQFRIGVLVITRDKRRQKRSQLT